MQKCNLIILFTNAQYLHFKNILKINNDLKKNTIIFTRVKINFNEAEDKSFVVYELNSFRKILQWKKALKRLCLNYEQFDLYVPHFLNVFAQDVYWRLKNSRKKILISIIPDGTLLFNDYKVKPFSSDNWKRKLKSLLFGLKYKLIKGSIISPYQQINTVYSYFENVVCEARNIKKICFEMKDHIYKNDNLLVLGHRNQKIISSDKVTFIVKNLVQSERFNSIYYKAHPRKELSKDNFRRSLSRSVDCNVINIESEEAIEGLIERYEFSAVFAVASSALISIKLIKPSIDCYSYGYEEYFGENYNKNIHDVFNSLNIKKLG